MKTNKTRRQISLLCNSISQLWHHLFGSLAVNDRFTWLSTNWEDTMFCLLRYSECWAQLVICSRMTLVSCVLLFCCLLKNIWCYCLRKTAHPPALGMLFGLPPASVQLSLFTKGAWYKAQYEAVYPLIRWPRKSEPTVPWMPLSLVCILRGTKGINESVLCVLPCCELPFNAFPRAALEMRYRGPVIETIFSIGCQLMCFSLWRQRERVKPRWPLKFTEERCPPRGSRERHSLRAISCNSNVV